MKIYVVTVVIDCFPEVKFFQTLEVAFEYIEAVIKQEADLDNVSIKPVFLEE